MNSSISEIFSSIRTYIANVELYMNITLDVQIISIKKYKTMIFINLSDGSDNIDAIIYGRNYIEELLDDDDISATGYITIYRGKIQFVIKSYIKIEKNEPSKFDTLKEKLFILGFFDQKPCIGNNYDSIGIISSLNAAGLRDFIYTYNSRTLGKTIYIYQSSMQGSHAPDELSNAIKLANNHNKSQLLAIIRGGGSKSDLACFDDETLAVSIYNSKIPIVTGIGHQIDISIADLVAAKSYITPTAVAENLTSTIGLKIKYLERCRNIIITKMNSMYSYIKICDERLKKNMEISINCVKKYQDNLQIKKNVQNSLINYFDLVFDYLSNNVNNRMNKFELLLERMTSSVERARLISTCKKDTICKYLTDSKNKISSITNIHIIDSNDNKIELLEDIISGEKYRIKFMDGILQVKIE